MIYAPVAQMDRASASGAEYIGSIPIRRSNQKINNDI
tara:strand:+ start:558 stop:668 length:111 start_codon:yes stop_codon:yes gene_type:complete